MERLQYELHLKTEAENQREPNYELQMSCDAKATADQWVENLLCPSSNL